MEMFNPGGSVKNHIGPAMIDYCEDSVVYCIQRTIVEPTSGNTGHGLAIAAAIKGYHCIFVMTDKVSEEKRSLLRAYGAEVRVICPSSVSHDSPEHYRTWRTVSLIEIPEPAAADQYWVLQSRDPFLCHDRPGNVRDAAGRITAFVAGMGPAALFRN